MKLWKSFWSAAAIWTLGLLALDFAHRVLLQFSGDYYHGPGAVMLLARNLPETAGLYLTVAVLAAGLQTGMRWRGAGHPRVMLSPILLVASSGLLVFLLLAYLAPLASHTVVEIGARKAGATLSLWEPMTRGVLRTEYLAAEAVRADDPLRAQTLGWLYYLQISAALLAALMSTLGLALGALLRRVPLYKRVPQAWGVGTLLVSVSVGAFLWGRRLAQQYGVPPATAAAGITLPAALALAVVAWLIWVRYSEGVAGRAA